MKTRNKIIITTVLLALLFWVVDATLDYFLYSEESFPEVLIFNLSAQEIYMRVLGSAFILIFGAIMAGVTTHRKQAEETVKKSESIYRTLHDNMVEGVIFRDANGELISMNHAAECILGNTAEQIRTLEMVKNNMIPIREDGSDYPTEEHPVFESLRTGQPVSNRVMGIFNNKEGGFRWVNISATPQFRSGEDKPYQVFITFSDITERKKAEETLHQYERIVSSSTDMLALLDKRYIYLAANKAYTEAFNLTPEQLVGNTVAEVFGEEFFNTVIKSNADRCLGGEVVTYQDWFGFPTYGRCYMDITYYPYYSKDNKMMGFVVDGRNITKRKQAEERLDESEELHRITLSNISDAVFVTDDSGNFTFICPNVDVIFGYSFEEVSDFGNISKLLGNGLFTASELDNLKEIRNIDCKITDKTSIKHDLLVNVKSVSIKEGTVLYTCRDITERKQAEEEIQKFKTIADSTSYGANIATVEGEFTYVNESFASMHGYTRDELIGTHFSELLLEEEAKVIRERRDHLQEEGGTFIIEVERLRKDGSTFPTITTGAIARDSEGNPMFTSGIIVDITERKRAEESLVESESRYRNFVETSMDMIAVVDMNGKYTFVNEAWIKGMGYSRETVREMNGFDSIHPDDIQFAQASFETLLNGKGVENNELRFKTSSGEYISVLTNLSPLRNNQDEIYAILTASRDITERKKAEEEIRKFKTVVDNAGYGAAIGTPEGKIIYVNEALAQMHGYTVDEFLGESFMMLYTRESGKRVQLLRDRLLQGGNYWVEEIWRRKKDGTVFPSLMTGSITRDGKGMPLYVSAVAIDITDRRRLEEQLRHSQVLATLGEMTAGISHEVNNPLASIILLSEVVLAGDMPKQTRRDLKVIQGEAKRAANIMRDLLTYSRRVQPRMRRVDLHGLIKKVLDMRKYQEKVRNINVTSNLLKGPLYVNGDSAQLTQVMINLVMNAEAALKETKAGEITVTTLADNERVKISVTDNGTGIPEENLNKIFNPFFTTRGVGKGTGLGLSTCYGIVTAHGGLIHVENNAEGGATFTVEIPLAGKGRQGVLPLETEEANS